MGTLSGKGRKFPASETKRNPLKFQSSYRSFSVRCQRYLSPLSNHSNFLTWNGAKMLLTNFSIMKPDGCFELINTLNFVFEKAELDLKMKLTIVWWQLIDHCPLDVLFERTYETNGFENPCNAQSTRVLTACIIKFHVGCSQSSKFCEVLIYCKMMLICPCFREERKNFCRSETDM